MASLLMVTGMTMLVPAVPLLRVKFGISNTQIGLAIGMFSAGRLIFDVPGGRFSERWGYRRVASIGIIVSLVGAVGAGASHTFQWLLVWRGVQGIGSALYTTAAFGIAVSLSAKGQMGRLISYYQGILLTGLILGPLLGGVVGGYFGLEGVFHGYAVMALFAFFLLIRVDGSSAKEESLASLGGDQRKLFSDIRCLLSNRAMRLALLVTYSSYWVRSGIRNTLLPLFMSGKMGFNGPTIGLLMAVVAVASIAPLFHTRTALDRHGRRPYVVWGTGATAAALFTLVPVTHLWMLIPTMAFLGVAIGYGGIAPAAVAVDVSPLRTRGTAMGLYRTAVDLGLLTGPVIIGALLDRFDYRIALVGSAMFVGLVGIVARALPETLSR